MDLRWIDPADIDRADLDGAVAVCEAAREVDCPHQMPVGPEQLRARLLHGWDGDPPLMAVARNGAARVVGVLEVSMSRWDNFHLAYVEPTVDPADRRRGYGRQLFDEAARVVRESGRTLVTVECFDSPAALGFAASVGLEKAFAAAKRRQDLRSTDWDGVEKLAAEAEHAAAEYELVRLPSPIPNRLMPAVIEMASAINDAPMDDLKVEDEVFTAERVHNFHRAQRAHGRRLYELAARHRGTGVFAGHTVVAVESSMPWYAHQLDTSVLRAHRGHRLGLLLKSRMLSWLAEAEPQLATVDTWNAISNTHMIAVNEALGYELVATASGFQQEVGPDVVDSRAARSDM